MIYMYSGVYDSNPYCGGGGRKTHGKDTLRATHGLPIRIISRCVLPQLGTIMMAGGSRGGKF